MTQVINFKKGTVAVAVLLVLVVAKTTNAVDFETSAVNGIDMKSAAGCEWALQTGVHDVINWSDVTTKDESTGPESGLDQCKKYCADKPRCTHWSLVMYRKGDFWACQVLADNATHYDPIKAPDHYDPNKSFCGYFPSRAPIQTDTVDNTFPKFIPETLYKKAKFAAGCQWSTDGTTAASYTKSLYKETDTWKSLSTCSNNCYNDKACTHWVYLVDKGTSFYESSECFALDIISPLNEPVYKPIALTNDLLDPDQSVCGLLTSKPISK